MKSLLNDNQYLRWVRQPFTFLTGASDSDKETRMFWTLQDRPSDRDLKVVIQDHLTQKLSLNRPIPASTLQQEKRKVIFLDLRTSIEANANSDHCLLIAILRLEDEATTKISKYRKLKAWQNQKGIDFISKWKVEYQRKIRKFKTDLWGHHECHFESTY